ncbi:MAG TPA: class I SAM-dependent methyltransferase, partial [Vicinamibacteria bacterium]|nr:class I SAM-dependent methyltransferase [Vicinamibacteria bacterium]
MARLIPLTPVVDLSSRKGQIRLKSRLRDSARHVFAVDLYSHLREKHPDTHVGYWVFPLPEGEAETTIGIDLTRIGADSLWLEGPQGRVAAVDSWSNPDYVFDPIVGIQLVLRRDGRVLENKFVAGRVADPEVLRSYYHRVHAEHGYTPAEPFLHELHAAMLRRLKRLFLVHFAPGARVLDAGCGRSLFTEIQERWPFDILACDVDYDLLAGRRKQFPDIGWVVGDAHPLPFRDAIFDGVFAGELIEHLP